MNKNRKIGLGFVLMGLVIIPLFYFISSHKGFVFAALMGLMAIAFGGFQLLLANSTIMRTDKATKARNSNYDH